MYRSGARNGEYDHWMFRTLVRTPTSTPISTLVATASLLAAALAAHGQGYPVVPASCLSNCNMPPAATMRTSSGGSGVPAIAVPRVRFFTSERS